MMKPLSRLLAVAALLAAAPLVAQDGAPLRVSVVNRTAVDAAAAGRPRAADEARPGDVLRYRLVFTNTAGRPIRQVQLANPLAGGVHFVAGSASASREDARAEYSIDAGRTFSAQPMEEVVVDGRRVRRPAPAERYTHVRWVVDGFVAPGATVTAEFDARIGGTIPSAPQSPAAPSGR